MTEEKDKKVEVGAKEEVKEDATPAETEEKKEIPAEEPKNQEATSGDGGVDVEVPKEFKALVEQVESMTVLELNSLVKLLEKKFGVSVAAVAVAGPADVGGVDEQDEFTVELTSVGDSKIGVIKAVKNALGLGLKEAKDLVDATPTVLKEEVNKEEAEELKKAIEGGGGTVTLK